jgi:NLR family CARD domain-containing protein 3
MFPPPVFPAWLREHCARLCARDDELRNLNLNIRGLDPRMMAFLAESMRDNDILVILNLTSSLARFPEAVISLAQIALPRHKSLKVLHLSYNRIQDASDLAKALATNECLEEVYLNYNRINDTGAEALAEGLRQNSTLRVLCMNSNEVGDQGCQALARALKGNTSLRDLSLERNTISIVGAGAIQMALRKNYTITTISLDWNNMPARHAASIQILCRANKAGRGFLANAGWNSEAVWPAFLERLNHDPDLLYFFLREKLDLLLTSSKHCLAK